VGLEQASKTSSPHAFAEVRHGKKWSSKSMPGPVHESNTQLYGLSCPTTTYCMATGTAFFFPSGGQDPGTPIVEIWHGSRWSLKRPSLPGPAIGGEVNDLDGVACSASTDCWAVGTTATDQASNPAVTARWDGHGFTKIDSDDPYPSDHLDAVGCAKESFCLAVGYGTTKTGRLRLYALKLRVVSCPRCKAGDPADVRSRAG
jgi:hypothetical protein